MINCYKCGCEVPGPNPECDACINGFSERTVSDLDVENLIGEALGRTRLREIDWVKVLTVEDYQLILRHTFSRIAIPEDHPAFEQLKRFLK